MGLFGFIDDVARTVGMKPPNFDLGAAAKSLMPPALQSGFQVGLNLVNSPVAASVIKATRNGLNVNGKIGFDASLALAHGHANGPPPPPKLSPQAVAAWHMTHGMQQIEPAKKAVLIQAVTSTPAAMPGVVSAIATIKAKKHWYIRLMEFLHFRKAT